MTIKNDNYNSYSLDFFGKECKNNYHNQCSGQWQGLGFQVTCNCECHTKKTELGKDVKYEDSYRLKSVAMQFESEG